MPVTINGSTGLTGVAAIDNVSSTELGYVDGVTSAIQTQFNNLGQFSTYTVYWKSATTTALGSGGSLTAKYAQIGKIVLVEMALNFGSTSLNVGSGIYRFNFPVTPTSSYQLFGGAYLYDSSANTTFVLRPDRYDTTDFYFYAMKTDGTYATMADFTASVPVPPASGDYLRASLWYEAA